MRWTKWDFIQTVFFENTKFGNIYRARTEFLADAIELLLNAFELAHSWLCIHCSNTTNIKVMGLLKPQITGCAGVGNAGNVFPATAD